MSMVREMSYERPGRPTVTAALTQTSGRFRKYCLMTPAAIVGSPATIIPPESVAKYL